MKKTTLTLHLSKDEKELIQEAAQLYNMPLKKFIEHILPYIASQIKEKVDA